MKNHQFVLMAVSLLVLALTETCADDLLHYDRDIRPVLSKYCFACHGPDEAARKADLRLDVRDSATQQLPSGERALVPGEPDQSEMLRRLTSSDPNVAMPPAESGKKPTEKEILLLRKWISQGAEYTQHWAYVKPVRPQLPPVSSVEWVSHAIDAFILARLDQEGLQPSAPAERPSLLRRMSLDLTGLPPTLAEADAFAGDTSPEAWERAIDRVLAAVALHGHCPNCRLTVDGVMDYLWSWLGKPQSSRFHRLCLRRIIAQRWQGWLGQRFSRVCLPGRPVPDVR